MVMEHHVKTFAHEPNIPGSSCFFGMDHIPSWIRFYNNMPWINVMVMSSPLEDLLKDAIEKEDRAFVEYRELAEKAPKSNIRWFLNSFSEARKRLRDKLTQVLEDRVDDDFGYPEEKIVHLKATQHLTFNGTVDRNSLQSVLLFISKREYEDLEYFRAVVERSEGEVADKFLRPVLAEKELIYTKADRLYHDLILTY